MGDEYPWPGPCEALFEHLAANDPEALLTMIRSGELAPTELTFAAEYAGDIEGHDPEVLDVLGSLLTHEKAYVREGVVYGLARMDCPGAIALLEKLRHQDADWDVQVAAWDVLEDS